MLEARAALLLMFGFLASCSMPATGVEGDEGSLTITVAGGPMRTLVPPIDMTPVSFDVSGVGPNGKTFSRSAASSSIVVDGLAFGTWYVTVAAKNPEDMVVGQGTGTATVVTGRQATLPIRIAPIAGDGTLDLEVTWIAADVQRPSIDAQLQPPSGPAIPLAFVMGMGSAGCRNDVIPAGYYTLSLKLLDGSVLVMGAVEIVRIVAGETTSGVFDFTAPTKLAGTAPYGFTVPLGGG